MYIGLASKHYSKQFIKSRGHFFMLSVSPNMVTLGMVNITLQNKSGKSHSKSSISLMSDNASKQQPHEQAIKIYYCRLFDEQQDLSANAVQKTLSTNKKEKAITIPVIMTGRTIDISSHTIHTSKNVRQSSQINVLNDLQSPQYTSSLIKNKLHTMDQLYPVIHENNTKNFSNINFDEDDLQHSDNTVSKALDGLETQLFNKIVGKNYTISGQNHFQIDQIANNKSINQKYASTQIEKQTINMNSDNTTTTKHSSSHKLKARAHTFDAKGNTTVNDVQKLKTEQKLVQDIIQQQNANINNTKERLASLQKVIYESQNKCINIKAKQGTQTLNTVALFLALVAYLTLKYVKLFKRT